MLTLPPLALYIHIPWCIKKCPYCDFNSHQVQGELPEQLYLESLLEDLKQDLEWAQSRSLTSIFIGGGTPSLISAAGYENLLKAIEDLIPFDPFIEITLEANPGTLEHGKFSAYKSAGINRLSIGAQSFSPAQLEQLGRIHSQNETCQAVEEAKLAGFDNFNLDLMFGLPNQTLEQALQDLIQAIDLGPTHLSWYQLTIEQNTLFFSKPPQLPVDDDIWTMQQAGVELLEENGFLQYEISAYAKQASNESKHNLNYWTFGDYLAIGAGAHGKITIAEEDRILRFQKTRLPKDYLNQEKPFLCARDQITGDQRVFEFMLNQLRLKHWGNEAVFESRTGCPIKQAEKQLNKAQSLGLLEREGKQFRPTKEGHLYLNNLLEIFLPE